jgi:hypothetical protein
MPRQKKPVSPKPLAVPPIRELGPDLAQSSRTLNTLYRENVIEPKKSFICSKIHFFCEPNEPTEPKKPKQKRGSGMTLWNKPHIKTLKYT